MLLLSSTHLLNTGWLNDWVDNLGALTFNPSVNKAICPEFPVGVFVSQQTQFMDQLKTR